MSKKFCLKSRFQAQMIRAMMLKTNLVAVKLNLTIKEANLVFPTTKLVFKTTNKLQHDLKKIFHYLRIQSSDNFINDKRQIQFSQQPNQFSKQQVNFVVTKKNSFFSFHEKCRNICGDFKFFAIFLCPIRMTGGKLQLASNTKAWLQGTRVYINLKWIKLQSNLAYNQNLMNPYDENFSYLKISGIFFTAKNIPMYISPG